MRSRYWLRTVATRALQHVRFLIVGTKVDMMAGCWSGDRSIFDRLFDRLSGATKVNPKDSVEDKLRLIEADMRSVVVNCCGVDAVKNTSFKFVTAMGKHAHYKRLRKEFKACLKSSCRLIFQGDAALLKSLRFPDVYREFRNDILKLGSLRTGLPILELESVTGSEYGMLVGSHSNAQSLQALRVLHDVGDVIFCNITDGKGSAKACLCWQPQIVADAIAQFAEPANELPIQRGCATRAALESILQQFLQGSPHRESDAVKSMESATTLFNFLLALRVFTPVERRAGLESTVATGSMRDSEVQYMVPSALKGRPSFWREVLGTQIGRFSCVRGVRLPCVDAMITVACFVRAMTQLCCDPDQMWGCAFWFHVDGGGSIFVRLAESRGHVDAVILGNEVSQLSSEHVDDGLRQVASFLHCSMENMLMLCPHCCASDMFARSGAVHAFRKEQLLRTTDESHGQLLQAGVHASESTHDPVFDSQLSDEAGKMALVEERPMRAPSSGVSGAGHQLDTRMVSCSRYHVTSKSGCVIGQHVGFVGSAGMPVTYPDGRETFRESLRWVQVSSTGLAETVAGWAEVLPNSFFSLSGQLKEGDVLSRESLLSIDDAVQKGGQSCRVRLRDATVDTELLLEYSVGQFICGKEIDVILSCRGAVEIQSEDNGVITTKTAHNFKSGDKVLLSVSKDGDKCNVEGLRCLVRDINGDCSFVLERVDSSSSLPLPLAGVCIMPTRTSFRATDNVLVVYKRAKPDDRRPPFDLYPGAPAEQCQYSIARLQPNDCNRAAEAAVWRDVEDNWAMMLGSEFQNYEITGITLFRCEGRERLFLSEVEQLERAAPLRPDPDFRCSIDASGTEKGARAALQKQVMGHFAEFSQKFSLLPPENNKDVNLSVAWWGKWPAVYHGAAQNGFWNLPSHLKIDPGYFGEGFYLTRYPRYSDYYINGFSLSKRKVENGSILMCYTVLGRPYPVTQDPFDPPLYQKGPPSKDSPCGKTCGASCGFSSSGGIDSHDSHYVTVKMHPKAGQYFPCPARQQPDFDEIVVFKADRILPVAYVSFQRR